MKRRRLLKIGAILGVLLPMLGLAFIIPTLGEEPSNPPTVVDSPAEIKELRAEIESLKGWIETLERQASTHSVFPYTNPSDVLRNQFPGLPSDQLPKGSVRKSFNGMTYYIIPLRN